MNLDGSNATVYNLYFGYMDQDYRYSYTYSSAADGFGYELV